MPLGIKTTQQILLFILIVAVTALTFVIILWMKTLPINSYQSEQGRRSPKRYFAININQSRQKHQYESFNTSSTPTSKDNSTGIQLQRKIPRRNSLQLKNRPRVQLKEKTHCKKEDSLSYHCYSKVHNNNTKGTTSACSTPRSEEFCNITGIPDQWTVLCDITSCGKKVYIWINIVNKIKWKEYENKEDLQTAIKKLIQSGTTRYCFISCFNLHSSDFEPQILNLPPPPQQTKFQRKINRKGRKPMNLNFIMVDSVPRTYFYNSLPRSVKVLDKIAAEHQDIMVLDFELVQGIRLRTFESLQALFSGYVNPYEIPFGINDFSKEKLNVAKWLLALKELDFSSLWLEDICPFTGWGLSRNLLVFNKTSDMNTFYTKFLNSYRQSGINDIGNTYVSCNILRHNKLLTPFDSKTICYNGKHHHSYLFQYLKMFQRTMHHRSEPFISYMELNTAHEVSGERIQYLDNDLAEYLRFSSGMSDTLTIVFSDHGSAYHNSKVRRSNRLLEVFNPFLFMIIPKAVQSFLTVNQIQALKINQERLVSLLDLHYTISFIIKQLHIENESEAVDLDSDVDDFNKQFNVTKEGLLTEISASRTCSIMPRIMPNLCVCTGYEVASANHSYDFILAIYLVGLMNNEILRHLSTSGDRVKGNKIHFGGFMNCKRMKVKKIKNVQEHHENNSTKTTEMDLYVETDGQIVDEVFFISLLITDLNISQGKYQRMTPFSKYSDCSDKGVEMQLCICSDIKESDKNVTTSNSLNAEHVLKSILYSNLQQNVTSMKVHDDVCLYLIEQFNENGVVYEVFNDCSISLTIRLSFRSENITLSTSTATEVKLYSGDVKFLAAGVSSIKWTCEVNVDFIV